MPDYIKYQRSIAQEFKALEDRVRFLIDDANWGEEGRYKEVIVMNYLKRILPKTASVGTGFVRGAEDISTQIDVIVYNNSYPCLFKEGDFVIVPPISVLAIIEVKTRIFSSGFVSCIEKANANGKLIMCGQNLHHPKELFNGIFCFNIENGIDCYERKLQEIDRYSLDDEAAVVNHISLGEKSFMRYWDCTSNHDKSCYNSYDFSSGEAEDLSFAYFFSNILLSMYDAGANYNRALPGDIRRFFFPIQCGKENYRRQSISMR